MRFLLEEISPELTDAITTIISEATLRLDIKQTDMLFLTLADHINFAIMRQVEEVEFTIPMTWDIKQLFKNEYDLGRFAVQVIAEKTGVKLPLVEASFIALHFVNASQSSTANMHETYKMTKLINDILEIIQSAADFAIDEESLEYSRLITHLNFFARSIVFQDQRLHADESFIQLDKDFVEEAAVAEKVAAFIKSEYDLDIQESEKVFLIIHLARTYRASMNGIKI